MMTPKALLTIVTCAALAMGSTCLLRVCVNQTNELAATGITLLERCVRVAHMPALWLGIALFVLSNALWFYVIATQPLVTAYPLQIALVFIFNTLSAAFFFSERLTLTGITGLGLILAGVALVSCFGTAK